MFGCKKYKDGTGRSCTVVVGIIFKVVAFGSIKYAFKYFILHINLLSVYEMDDRIIIDFSSLNQPPSYKISDKDSTTLHYLWLRAKIEHKLGFEEQYTF